MQIRSYPVIFLSLFALTGCGKFLDKFSRLPKPGFTIVKTSGVARTVRGARAETPLNGGMLIYAHGFADGNPQPQTHTFRFDDDGGATGISFPLENGHYHFYVVGYTGSGMSGSPRCGNAVDAAGNVAEVTLTGGTQTVDISTSASNCATGEFASSDFVLSGNLRSLKVAFCAGSSDLSAVSGSCSGGNESARFFAGATSGTYAGAANDQNVSYNEATGRFIYAADPHSPNHSDLYSVRDDGTGTVMQNHPVTSGANVKISTVRSAPDALATTANLVAFTISEGPNFDKADLYLTRAGIPGDIKVTPAITCASVCSPNNGGAVDFRFTADGHYLIFLAENGTGTAGVSAGLNIYSVDLTSLNFSAGTFTRVQLNNSSTALYRQSFGTPRLELSNASPYPVLFVEAGASSRNELFLNTPDGLNRTNVGAKHAIVASNAGVALDTYMWKFNFDGTKILWTDTASDDYPNSHDFGVLLSCSISSLTLCGTATEVSNPHRQSGYNGATSFHISSNSNVAVYSSDEVNPNQRVFDIYSVNLATSATTKVFDNQSTIINAFPEVGRFSPAVGGVQYFSFFWNENACTNPPTCSSPVAAFRTMNSVRIGTANSRVNHSRRPDTDATITGGNSQWQNATHVLQDGDKVRLVSTGTLPANFSSGTDYFVVARTATGFGLATTLAGTAILAGDAGSGTHTIVPRDTTAFHPSTLGGGSHDEGVWLKESSGALHLLFLATGGNDGTLGTAALRRLYDATPGVPSAADTSPSGFTNHPSASFDLENLGARGATAFVAGGSPVDGFSYTPGGAAGSRWRKLLLTQATTPSTDSSKFPDTLKDLMVPGGGDEELTLADGTPFAMMRGFFDNNANTPNDLWLIRNPESAATPSPVKLTRMKNGPILGRYQISLLGYHTFPNGALNFGSLFPALATACLPGNGSTDGSVLNPSVQVPGGNECDGSGNCPFTPFLIGIDVFPEATDCSGTPTRKILSGLQGLQSPTASSPVSLVPFSSELKLFVRD